MTTEADVTEASVPGQAAPGDDQVTEQVDVSPDVDVVAINKFLAEEKKREALEEKARQVANDPDKHAKFKAWQADEEAKTTAPKQGAAEDAPQVAPPPREYPYDQVFNMHADTKTPSGYKVNRGGVFVRQNVGNSEQWVRICLAPLVITAVFIDADGDQSVELAWYSRGSVVRRLVSRGLIRRGRKLIEVLGSAGLPVVEADARAVERWLGEFEVANIKTLPNSYVARYLGWQPDETFVSGPEEATYVAPLYDDQKRAAAAYRPKGSPKRWQAAMARLEAYPAARAVLAAAFAPVLLGFFEDASFIVDISFKSTSGKTTCVRCAMSAWADPSERGGAVSPWDITPFALEKKLNLVRGLPSVLDDTMLARDPALIGGAPYMVSMDKGRSRGGGDYPSVLEWQTILLSTGERSVLSYTKGQGASVRVLALARRPLAEGNGALAEELNDVVTENYGHAGPEFARRFRELLTDSAGKTKLKARRDELVELLRGDTAMTGRRAPKIALLALADELACDWGVLPFKMLPIDAWQQMFTEQVEETDDRSEQAMEIIRGHVASNFAHLYDSQAVVTQSWQAGEVRVPPGGWLGVVRRPRNGTPRIAIQPQRVREILKRAEIEYDAVLQGWLEAGHLEQTAKSGKPYLINVKVGKAGAKHLVFTETAIPFDPPEDE